MIRIVVCIDIDTDSVVEAYPEVYKSMDKTGLAWESSDEWYDDDGSEGDPSKLQAARMVFFDIKDMAEGA